MSANMLVGGVCIERTCPSYWRWGNDKKPGAHKSSRFVITIRIQDRSGEITLAALPMVDSSGIGTFARMHKLLKEAGGPFTLFAPSKMVRQTLKMVGLDRFFGLYDDEASALQD